MDPFDLNTVLGIALAALVARLFRYLAKTKFWKSVWGGARDIMQDPNNPTTDPEKAVEQALLDMQRPTVKKIARSLRESVQPASSTETPTTERPTPQLVRKADE